MIFDMMYFLFVSWLASEETECSFLMQKNCLTGWDNYYIYENLSTKPTGSYTKF